MSIYRELRAEMVNHVAGQSWRLTGSPTRDQIKTWMADWGQQAKDRWPNATRLIKRLVSDDQIFSAK